MSSSGPHRKHGGRREGAGRPRVMNPKEKHTVTFSLPAPMKKRLDAFVHAAPKDESRSSVIREALRRFLNI